MQAKWIKLDEDPSCMYFTPCSFYSPALTYDFVLLVVYCAGTFKAISSVNDHLYICGVMALKEEKVKALGINCVINATLEWPALNIPGLEVGSGWLAGSVTNVKKTPYVFG